MSFIIAQNEVKLRVMHILMDEICCSPQVEVVVVVVANNNSSSWCPYLFQMFLISRYSESRGKSSIEMWKFKRCLDVF